MISNRSMMVLGKGGLPFSLPWKTCENCGAIVPMAHDYELRNERGEAVKRRLCAACYSKLHTK